MFDASVYAERRRRLADDVGSGLILLLGNGEPPMNYPANAYPFRQDSSFLYFFGVDVPDMAGVIDAESGAATVYGDDFTVDDIVWRGPQPTVADLAAPAGITGTQPRSKLAETLGEAISQGRRVHVLPPYRAENALLLERLIGMRAEVAKAQASVPLIRAVVKQRAVKSAEELSEIERAIDITGEMQIAGMRRARPGVYEREIAGAMAGIAAAHDVLLAFPIIFSVRGETLHNHDHGNRMDAGHMAVNDCGAESPMHYAGDITRTIPIGGRFEGLQRDLYLTVLRAQEAALAAIKPGVRWRDIHLLACRCLAEDLKAQGFMKGDVAAAVEAGAHALFFQCGLGHMMGLDVHDMEDVGEHYVGYDEPGLERSRQFGLKSLRMGRTLQPGFVMTVEPGIYVIPALIDMWRAENRFAEFIDYPAVERIRAFGGIRIEDDVVVTGDGYRLLGRPIPKAIHEVEAIASA